ncbi:MAG: 2-hydroxyacid dehydrogenase [Flavobacteriaceae bacterium]
MDKHKVLHVDENHPLLLEGLTALGYENIIAYDTPLEKLLFELNKYQGIVIRSRFPIDKKFLNAASQLKFIARVGAGLENIDISYASSKNIALISAPEGNRNAVGEHALGMLLSLMNKLRIGHQSIAQGNWLREEHRGWELENKTVGIIGYGNTGKSFAKKLSGFNNLRVLCHDILPNVGDQAAHQVSLKELQEKAQVISLHVPQTAKTQGMINKHFIDQMQHPFWLINTARGKAVVTEDLTAALKSGKILGAGLDVLEYESSSFYSIFNAPEPSDALSYLLKADQVLLSPHVGGWTVESHRKLAQTILDKIKTLSSSFD